MKKLLLYISLLTIIAACREVYDIPIKMPDTGYLVVEGMINSSNGPTTIKLSRTQPIVDSGLRRERFAHVRVEGEDNTSTLLYEISEGTYRVGQLSINNNIKYRLHIFTIEGKEYLSEYNLPRRTPPIDDITWERGANGVELFINTHDPQNNTWYYKWDTEETWEFTSYYIAGLRWVYDFQGRIRGVRFATAAEVQELYTCWASETSKGILIGSSARLSRDTIHLPIINIPEASWKISILYSVNVKQYAQSKAAYDYLHQMKKNTEQLGTLFDPQPSQLIGNIQCVQDPAEPVVGFVEVAELQEKRVFISRSDVAPWNYSQGCPEEVSLPALKPDSLNQIQEPLLPTSPHEYDNFGTLIRFWAAIPDCVDCTRRGTNVKPPYWP